MSHRRGEDDHDSDPLDSLVASYIERLRAGETIDPFVVLSENPDRGEEMLEMLRDFLDLGVTAGEGVCPRILGDYTLGAVIGRGGMGVVYDAWQNSMERRVALKILPAALAADSRACARFLREAQTAGKINHPHVVPVYSLGVEGGTPYYAMERVEGETVARILERLRADIDDGAPFQEVASALHCLTWAESAAAVAEGLHHAHAHGVIHRDVKPSNIIRDADGRLRLLDFGLARMEGAETVTIGMMGTPRYMSPEQVSIRRISVGPRTDVYSLGATLYEIVTLHPPFEGRDYQETLSQILSREAAPPRRLNRAIPRDLETIILRCLEKDPANRYLTAEALAQDLRRLVRGDPIEARPLTRWQQIGRRVRSHPVSLILAAAVTAVLSLSGLLFWNVWTEERSQALAEYERLVRGARMTFSVAQSPEDRGITWSDRFRELISESESNPLLRGIADLERAVELMPERVEAHYFLAQAFHELGREKESAEALARAARLSPSFLPIRRLLHSLDVEDRPLSLRLRSGPIDPAWQVWIAAEEATEARRWTDAAAALRELSLRPHGGDELYLGAAIDVSLQLAEILYKAGDMTGAIWELAYATRVWSGFIEPWLLLGRAHYAKGEADLAERAFRKTIGRDDATVWITKFYWQQGLIEQALKWTDHAVSSDLRRRLRTFVFLRTGRLEEALEEGLSAIRADPGNLGARGELIWILYLHMDNGTFDYQGIVELGIDTAKEMIAIDSEQAGAWTALGACLSEAGKFDEAMSAFHEARKRAPDDYGLAFQMGVSFFLQERFVEAREEFERTIALGRRSIGHNALGWLLVRQGAYAEARRNLEESIAIDPTSQHPYINLGWLELAEGNPRVAQTNFGDALKLTPSNPLATIGLARAYRLTGEVESALDTAWRGLARPAVLADRKAMLDLVMELAFLRENLAGLLERLQLAAGSDDGLVTTFANTLGTLAAGETLSIDFSGEENGGRLREIFGRTQPHGSYLGFDPLPPAEALHVPVFPGSYMVSLEFRSVECDRDACPVSVQVEGKLVLQEARPDTETAVTLNFPVRVEDMFLDLEVAISDGRAIVSRFEAERIED